MKVRLTALLLAVLAGPAGAATIWEETIDGDISSNVAAPTVVVLALGSNTIIGSVSNLAANPGERDVITFTIPAGRKLSALKLVALAPDNLNFLSFNAGATSFIPSLATNASFLAGIHVAAADVGSNLMPAFDNLSVTTNSLPAPELPAGTYCFLNQQTSPIIQSYELEFVITEVSVPTELTSWGKLKTLYQ